MTHRDGCKKNRLEDFKDYGLSPEDFKVDTYKVPTFDNDFQKGVEIGIPLLAISIKCHSEKSQIKNRDECLRIIKIILDNRKVE